MPGPTRCRLTVHVQAARQALLPDYPHLAVPQVGSEAACGSVVPVQ